MKYMYSIFAISVALILIVWYGYTQLAVVPLDKTTTVDNSEVATTTTNSIQVPGTLPANWKKYENQAFNFTFWYPPKATTTIEAGQAKVRYLGPDNTIGSEITDGFTLYVRARHSTSSLEGLVEELYQNDSAQLRILSEPALIGTFAEQAYSYQLESMLGTIVTHIVKEAGDNQFFNITYTITGDTEGVYAEYVEKIITSVQIVE